MTNFLSRTLISPSYIAFFTDRMQGPGGYYNIGNFIGLSSGLVLQMLSMQNTTMEAATFSEVVTVYFIGSLGATALTFSMLTFFCAGELYHRAWNESDGVPDERLNRWADFVSGIGALLLASSLTSFGDIWLAITTTVLLAGGKFGSALGPAQGWHVRIESTGCCATTESYQFDLFRSAVVLSRAPAIFVLVYGLITPALSGVSFGIAEAQSAVLFVCFALWTRADLLLGRI